MVKHEHYSQLLEDDSEFEVQEGWMGECQDFMAMEMGAKMYLDSKKARKARLKTYDTSAASKANNKSVAGQGSSEIPRMQIEDEAIV